METYNSHAKKFIESLSETNSKLLYKSQTLEMYFRHNYLRKVLNGMGRRTRSNSLDYDRIYSIINDGIHASWEPLENKLIVKVWFYVTTITSSEDETDLEDEWDSDW